MIPAGHRTGTIVSLKHFLQSGCIGGLEPGVTRAQVIDALGLPENVGGTSWKHRQPAIFRYGSLEVHFARTSPSVCERIYVEHWIKGSQIQLPEGFVLEEWGLSPSADRDEVEHYLQTNGIQYEVVVQEDGILLAFTISSSGVVIHLDDANLLWSISVSRESKLAPEV